MLRKRGGGTTLDIGVRLLKETNVDVVQALPNPLRYHPKADAQIRKAVRIFWFPMLLSRISYLIGLNQSTE